MADQPQAEPPRYRFIIGEGDEEHAKKVNEANKNGYRAILMCHRQGGDSGGTVSVLMEREL